MNTDNPLAAKRGNMGISIQVLHGPNLNLLGVREPEVYGRATLVDVDEMIRSEAKYLGIDVECFQSNIEGELVNALHAARERRQGVVINPGA